MANMAMPDLGAGAVQQTAGGPSFLSTLAAMTPSLGGGPAGGMAALVNPGAAAPAAPNPLGLNAFSGSGTGRPQLFWNPQNTPQPVQSAPTAAAASGSAPTLNDYINALVGSAPTAPQASDFGPAPTLGDFFSADPYNQALAALKSGTTNAQGSINTDYQNATNTMGQIAAQVAKEGGNLRSQVGSDQQRAADAVNGYINQANAAAGPGGGVASRLAGLQGTLAGQQAAQSSLMDTILGLQNFNASQDQAGLATNKQAALDSLNAASSGEANKINLTEAQDQAKAQQALNAALGSRGAAMAKANTDYQNALRAYQGQRASILGDASKMADANTLSNTDAAKNTMTQWAQQAAGGDQNAQALTSAAELIFGGGKVPSTTGGQPTTVGAPKNAMEAYDRLNTMATHPNSPFPPGTIMYNILKGLVDQYYMGGKTSPDLLGALKQMVG